MSSSPLIFLEFFVVLMFGLAWLILEWVAKKHDKPPANTKSDQEAAD